MMNLQRIKIHRECCDLLLKAGLDKELTMRCNEQSILLCSEKIIEFGISEQIHELGADIQERLLNGHELREYVFELLRKGAPSSRCKSLLDQMEADVLFEYDMDKVMDILSDDRISGRFLAVYLKYYRDADLTETEKEVLAYALANYFFYRKSEDEALLLAHNRLFCSELISSGFLLELHDYDACLIKIAEDERVFDILQEIYKMSGQDLKMDDDTFQQIEKEPDKIVENLRWAEQFFSQEEKQPFIKLLVENHSLLYDLEMLRKKVNSGLEQEAHQMVKNRIAYISFFYNNQYIDQWRGEHMEALIIYAISHKKKAFLLLIQENKEIFISLPSTSVLFQVEFYSHVVNINTLNQRNLRQCRKIINCQKEFLELFYDKKCTFEEFAVLSEVPIEYTELYFLLQISRVDDRLRVIREIIHRGCLEKGMNLPQIAEQLSVQPFSQWMQKTFSGIEGINSQVGMKVLENYKKIKHLIKDVRTVAEARYIACNALRFQKDTNMDHIRERVLRENEDWLQLQEKFQFTQEFIRENEERIRTFIFDDGAYIMWTYLKQMRQKTEELRRLVFAELSGRFRELKYFENDLEKELDFPVSEFSKNIWRKNLQEEKEDLRIWEEDGLLPVMRIGEVPYHTCLSYQTGTHKECLLACHDSNKKILCVSFKGKIVLRAAIRLTKGFCGTDEQRQKEMPQLEFADLSNANEKGYEKQEIEKEQLVLFLERAYMAELPENMQKLAVELIFRIMKRKAGLLRAALVASRFYCRWKPEGMHSAVFSVYISKSKAGSQYLDSLDGSKSVINEGSYQAHNFLLG